MPTAMRAPDSKNASIGGVPAPVRMLPRGQVTNVAPFMATRCRLGIAELHAMDDQQAIVEKTHPVEIFERMHLGAPTRRIPRPEVVEQAPPWSRASQKELEFGF